MSSNHSFNYHAYMVTPQDFEYDVTIADAGACDAHTVRLLISKVGGGEVDGQPSGAYTGAWYYRLDVDGETVAHGDDYSVGTPHTHAWVARSVAEILAETVPDSGVAEILSDAVADAGTGAELT